MGFSKSELQHSWGVVTADPNARSEQMGPCPPCFCFASEDVLAVRTGLVQFYDKKEDTDMGDFAEKTVNLY